jgi:hypothetical protein
MHYLLSSVAFKAVFSFFISLFVLTHTTNAQSCTNVSNFITAQYNTTMATYEWNYADNIAYYILEIKKNGQNYHTVELPGTITKYQLDFAPALKHDDKIEAKLTQYCNNGAKSSAATDFIIVVDAIVYLIGNPNNGGTIKVEPVMTVNDNLVPANKICGLCDPNYFRITSGFYAPFGIAVSTASTLPIEQLRFEKTDLCNCFDQAIADGILAPNGGHGPKYNGTPFNCNITLYAFIPSDCNRETRGKERTSTPFSASNSTLQVAPNPSTDFAQITFSLPEASMISVIIYDIMGNAIATVANTQQLSAGDYTYPVQIENLPSGIYFCTLKAQDYINTVKLSVVGK